MRALWRRRAIVAIVVAVSAAVGSRRWLPTAAAKPARPASVLIITLDTTRADYLEPYGAEEGSTPALARLAAESAVFEQVSAVVPTTLPAHISIMTGLYPPQHGVRVDAVQRVPDELRTLAERLHDAGYRTGAFVSAMALERSRHLDQGFEVYDDRMLRPKGDSVPRRSGAATVLAAEEWLASIPADERFFAWIHLDDAHAPFSPVAYPDARFAGRPYAQAIAVLDALVGRILDDPRIRSEERLIVHVIGDHGESLGEHGEAEHGLLAYDATLRIPWILRAPDIRPGTRLDGWVSQVDVVPTTLELLGLPAEPALAGTSLASLLTGPEGHAPVRALYAEEFTPFYSFGWSRLRSFRLGRWKYIESATEHELYDTETDPGELSDLGSRERETTFELASAMRDYVARLGGDRERDESVRPSPRDVVHLRDSLVRAQRLVDKEETGEAIALLEHMLAEEPINTAALGLLVDALAMQGQVDDALHFAKRVRALEPWNPARWVRLSELEERRGDRARAINLVAQALVLDARFGPGRLQKVSLLRAEGFTAEADDVLRQGLRSDPDDVPLNLAVARDTELANSDPAAAEERLLRTVERAPYASEGWRLLGVAREALGLADEAIDAYRRGTQANPEDAVLQAALGLRLVRSGRPGEAEIAVRAAMRLAPAPTPGLWTTLGAALADQGRLFAAEEAYTQAIALDAKDPLARNGRALVWLARGQIDDARREFSALTDEFPNFGDAENNLAAIAIGYRNWSEAERRARRALRHAETAPAWNNLGVALDGQGRDDEAMVAYGKALASDARYWQARLNLAISQSATGHRDEALAGLEEVLRQVPGQPEASLQLAYLYRQGGDTDRAREQLEAFLQVVSGPAAEEARRRFDDLRPVTTQ